MDQSDEASVPAQAPKPVYDGRIDDRGPAILSGWSVSADAEAIPVTLTIPGRAPIALPASGGRPDLAAAGKSRGDGGWRIDVSELLQPGANSIDVRFPDGSPLPGSPVIVDGPAAAPEPAQEPEPEYISYVGAIDLSEPPFLSGWSISSKRDAVPITIEMDDRAPILVAADGPRPDLVDAGYVKAGGGWSLEITDLLLPGTNHIRLRFPNGQELPGSPLSIRNGDGPDRAPVVNAPPPIPAAAEPLPVPEPAEAPPTAEVAPEPEPAAPPSVPAPPEPTPIFARKPEAAPHAGQRPLTLAELDEISLDDLILAVESGIIDVPPPPPPPPLDDDQAAPARVQDTAEPRAERGFLSRIFGRR